MRDAGLGGRTARDPACPDSSSEPVTTIGRTLRVLASADAAGLVPSVPCKSLPLRKSASAADGTQLLQTKNHDVEMIRAGATRFLAERRADDTANFPFGSTSWSPADHLSTLLMAACSLHAIRFSSNGQAGKLSFDPWAREDGPRAAS